VPSMLDSLEVKVLFPVW